MQIIVEDNIVNLELPRKNVSLKQVVDETETFLLTVGKVPVGLSINGVALSQEELLRREGEILQGDEVFKFDVIALAQYLIGNLDGAALSHERLTKRIQTFAQELHSPAKSIDSQTFFKEFTDFFEFWWRLHTLFPDSFKAVSFADKPFFQHFSGVQSLLGESVKAMEGNDFVLASDLLQHEVVPAMEVMREAIPQLKATITNSALKSPAKAQGA